MGTLMEGSFERIEPRMLTGLARCGLCGAGIPKEKREPLRARVSPTTVDSCSARRAVCERSPGEQSGQIRGFAASRKTVRIANPAGCAGRSGTDSRIRSVPALARGAVAACPVGGQHGPPNVAPRAPTFARDAPGLVGLVLAAGLATKGARSRCPLSRAGSRRLLHDEDLGPRLELELGALLLPHAVEDP